MKKDGKPNEAIPEDEPDKYKHAVYVMVMKVCTKCLISVDLNGLWMSLFFLHHLQLFADMERRRQQLETRDQEERKRKREGEIDDEERHKAETEWQKNFEESRQNRVNSWHDFQSGSGSKKKAKKEKKEKKEKKYHSFNPPKLKPETR